MKHRILLADDSPHAQRMGERILREEGYEVVSVTDGNTALIRWKDFSPDLVIANVSLPTKSGYDVCRGIKENAENRFTKVILTAGLLEPFDQERAREAGSDGVLRKPFEASSMLETVQTLIEASQFARQMFPHEEEAGPADDNVVEFPAPVPLPAEPQPVASPAPRLEREIDPGLVRAAVALAVEAVIPKLIDEITENVVETLKSETDHARQQL